MNQFRKLDQNDNLLPDDAPEWASVLQVNANLVWSKDDISDQSLTAKQADKACAEFRPDDARQWRLPTVEELFALADRSREGPAIDTTFFPSCKRDWYWSSTKAAWSAGVRWIVYFANGNSHLAVEYDRARVRAVRSWSGPLAVGDGCGDARIPGMDRSRAHPKMDAATGLVHRPVEAVPAARQAPAGVQIVHAVRSAVACRRRPGMPGRRLAPPAIAAAPQGPESGARRCAGACPHTEYSRHPGRGQSMTKLRYPQGCSAGSKEHEEASAWSAGVRWIVNFNNGNSVCPPLARALVLANCAKVIELERRKAA